MLPLSLYTKSSSSDELAFVSMFVRSRGSHSASSSATSSLPVHVAFDSAPPTEATVATLLLARTAVLSSTVSGPTHMREA
eukprot:2018811-Pleurochrysis_carterae.AAC.1